MEREELWSGGPRFQQTAHFRLGTDSILLADFAVKPGAARGVDLGCGSGILALLLLEKTPRLHMTGLELQETALAVARENIAQNALDKRFTPVCGDWRQVRDRFRSGSFDLAVCNPPYFAAGSGALPPDPARAAARAETDGGLSELVQAAAWLLHTGGSLFLCYRPERLSELFVCLSGHGLEPKRLRLVCHRADSAPSLALVEARRGGRIGLRVEKSLVLFDENDAESAEYRRIYHRA